MSDIYTWGSRHGVSAEALTELLDMLDPTRATLNGRAGDGSEASVSAELRVRAARFGAALWRNNSGAVTTDDGRHIRFGLGNDSKRLNTVWKSSDLIGITPMQSSAPGQVFGVFTAVECKKPGWSRPKNKREEAQLAFLNTVKSMGGLALFATSPDDYMRMRS